MALWTDTDELSPVHRIKPYGPPFSEGLQLLNIACKSIRFLLRRANLLSGYPLSRKARGPLPWGTCKNIQ